MKIKYIFVASMVVFSIFLAGCISDDSSSSTVVTPANEEKSNSNNEKEQIGTYNNPAKVGDVVRLEINSIVYGKKAYDVSVDKYIRGNEANKLIKNANMFNSEPQDGYEYLLVKVKVKYVSGEDPVNINSYDFKAYCNGVGYDEAFEVLPDSYPGLKNVELKSGGEISGWILYEVPKNEDVLIEYTPLIGSSSCYIKLD